MEIPLLLAGVGRVGIRLASEAPVETRLFVDTDSSTLTGTEGSNIFLGAPVGGLGTGGNHEEGYRVALHYRDSLFSALDGAETVIAVGAAGGGTGGGVTPVLAECAKERGSTFIALLVEPFPFEGTHRVTSGKQFIEMTSQHSDAVLVAPNKLRKRASQTTMSFAEFRSSIDSGIRGALRTISQGIGYGVEPAHLRRLFEGGGIAEFGYGEARPEEGLRTAFQRALLRSFIDPESLTSAQKTHIIISADGRIDLRELSLITEEIEELSPNAKVETRVTTPPTADGFWRVVIIVRGTSTEEVSPEPASFQTPQDAVIVDGVNLEIATYIRRRRSIH